MTTLQINHYYELSVYVNSVLGKSYKSVKLVSILDYNTALKFANVDLLHRQIYPYLPVGTSTDNKKYTYYLFDMNGKQVVIAGEWMIPSSITEVVGVNYTLQLNGISPAQLSVVRDQLRLLGISYDLIS